MDFHLTAEHKEIQNICRSLAADFATRTAQHDRDNSLPIENYAALKQAGLYSLTVPKELGGWGADFLGWVLAAEELAQGCPATALTFNMHAAVVGFTMDDPTASPAGKKRIAALTVEERKLIAAGVSEPGTSSLIVGPTYVPAVQARRTRGGYSLRGRKVFLSMLEGCDYISLLAHPEEDTNPLASILFLVPRSAHGQHVEEVWDTLGMRGTRSNNLILEDCVVPAENCLGSTDNFLMWFESLPQWGFGSYTAVYLGVAAAAYRQACEVLKQRVPRGFTQPLSYHPDIRRRVAEMSVDLEAARLLMYHAAWLVDTLGVTPESTVALMRAKYFVGEAVTCITRSAITACGAHALFKTSRLEQLFRDGASAPIQPPAGDACLTGIGMLELGLEPTEMLPPLKVQG
jgi:alkylation response protein AidB-like acyl-CoA dehydrogenase